MKLLEFAKKFDSEEACEQHLRAVREKEGITCPKCGCKRQYWFKGKKHWACANCHHETSLTSGTVMHGSKLPLMYWFTAIHLLTATKKSFSTLEMQRQLGHKRYQPIWEMMHKLRSVMGERDAEYKLKSTIELDEGYFTTDLEEKEKDKPLKRGLGSQKKSKVLVMVESEKTVPKKKTHKERKCGHLKMQIIEDLNARTFREKTSEGVEANATVVMDDLRGHGGVETVIKKSERQKVKPKDAPKVLPWVHVAIANAKSLFADLYHGFNEKFLQNYLNEYCYKFNRRFFGERIFDRLMITAVSCKPAFEHRIYNRRDNCG